MQQKVYHARDAQNLLLKAPPASGKSRVLMFIALDKLVHQEVDTILDAIGDVTSVDSETGVIHIKILSTNQTKAICPIPCRPADQQSYRKEQQDPCGSFAV